MNKVYGNTPGLKPGQISRLQKLYRRRVPSEHAVSPELARDLAALSHELSRQVGLLLDRSGSVHFVIVGDDRGLTIPDLSDYRRGKGRLAGLRLVHTHLNGEELTEDDLTDLALLRLDLICAFTVGEEGQLGRFHLAHILPAAKGGKPYSVWAPFSQAGLDIGLSSLLSGLEAELSGGARQKGAPGQSQRALLVSVTPAARAEAEEFMEELKELCRTAGVSVAGTVIQHRAKPDPRFLLGRGKLTEVALAAASREADLVVFDQDLNPSQIRSITEAISLPVIDRTQLILDIFAQRAMTREGKLQVELAQLKYRLPRLAGKGTALSRLMGGIGGRGPGETKLEIDRRRARERIRRLEKELAGVSDTRRTQTRRRGRQGLFIASIVGYTNAGKSTLLNALTRASVLSENRLFATLDPTSRRLRLPRERADILITDTVGFIRDLPPDLATAFTATLEQLFSADLLLHVIDVSNPRMENQVLAVEKTLDELDLSRIPSIRVLNKTDLLDPESLRAVRERMGGVPVSALSPDTLAPLVSLIEEKYKESQGAVIEKNG
ncbi:MAG: GTPase HflX [Thermodesulfobacteriota bacterium]